MHVFLGGPTNKQILSITRYPGNTTIYELGKLELDSEFLFFFIFYFFGDLLKTASRLPPVVLEQS